MKALLLGATGLIGREVLTLLEGDARFEEVLVLARRPSPAPRGKKVQWRVVDFDAPATYAALAGDAIDVVFCCLGTTLKQAGSKEAFRRIDLDIPLRVADALASRAGEARYLLVSSIGAKSDALAFYSRTKGELESALAQRGFRGLDIFQPSFLLGERGDHRPLEAIFSGLTRALQPALRGPLRSYRAISGARVAHAMVETAGRPPHAPVVFHRYAEMIEE